MRNSGIAQSAVMVVGNVIGTGLSAIALILISRLLGPEKFGVFSVGFSIVLILIKINDFGLSTALLKFASAQDELSQKKEVIILITKYKLIISVLIALVGIVFYRPIANVLNLNDPKIVLLSFTIGLATAYYEHLMTILQSLHRFVQVVLINAIQAISKLLVSSGLFLLHIQATLPHYTWYIFAPIVPLVFLRSLLPSELFTVAASQTPDLHRRIVQLTKHSAVGLIAAGLIENIDVIFLQRYLESYETGMFSAMSRIALIFSLMAYSLATVLNPRVARYRSTEHLKPYLIKAFLVLIAALVGFLAFIPFSGILISLSVGPEYASGQSMLILLTAASFITIMTIPFMALFYAFEANWFFSVSGVIQLVVVLIGNIVFVPMYGADAAAWTRLTSRSFLFIFTIATTMFIIKKMYARKNAQTK